MTTTSTTEYPRHHELKCAGAAGNVGMCLILLEHIQRVLSHALGQLEEHARDLRSEPTPEGVDVDQFVRNAEHLLGELNTAALYAPDVGVALAAIRTFAARPAKQQVA